MYGHDQWQFIAINFLFSSLPGGPAKKEGTKAIEITQTMQKNGGLTGPKYKTIGGTTIRTLVILLSEPLPAGQHSQISKVQHKHGFFFYL